MNLTTLAYIALALSMVMVGSYVALAAFLVQHFNLFILIWLRFLIAILFLAPWLKNLKSLPNLAIRSWVYVFLQSFFGNFLFSIFMLYGVQLSGSVSAAVIFSFIPLVVVLLSHLLLHEKLTLRIILAMACAISAMLLLQLDKADSIRGSWWGDVLLLGALLTEGIYVVLGKRLTRNFSPIQIAALMHICGWALVTPLAAWAIWQYEFSLPAPIVWSGLVYYAFAASVASVWLWMYGLNAIPANRAGIFTVLLPVSTAIFAMFFGAAVSAIQWLVLFIAIASIALVTTDKKPSEQVN